MIGSPVDTILSDLPPKQHHMAPDIIFVAADRQEIMAERCIQGAPDLIVEILSPSTAERDLQVKKAAYEESGVKHYRVVDPEGRTLTAFVLRGGKYIEARTFSKNEIFAPAGFPGLEIPLAKIWH